MAKNKNTIQPTRKELERKNSRLGMIGDFFKNIFAKIKNFFRVLAGKEPLPDKQWADKPVLHEYKPSDQIMKEQVEFEGYDQMQIGPDGLVRVPAGTERTWSLDDKQKYIDVITKKFPDMPDPQVTGDGAFASTIAYDISKVFKSETNTTLIYALAGKLVVADCQNGVCNLSISDGKKEATAIITDPEQAHEALLKTYAQSVDAPLFLIDARKHAKFAVISGPDKQPMVYTIENHYPHIQDYNEKAFINHKSPLQAVYEIKAPDVISTAFIEKAVKFDEEAPTYQWRESGNVATALHESLFKDPGYRSTFVLHGGVDETVKYDTVVWLTSERDTTGAEKFFINAAAVHTNFGTTAVKREISPEAFDFSQEGNKAFRGVLNRALKGLSVQVKTMDEQSRQMDDIKKAFEEEQNMQNQPAEEKAPDEPIPDTTGTNEPSQEQPQEESTKTPPAEALSSPTGQDDTPEAPPDDLAEQFADDELGL